MVEELFSPDTCSQVQIPVMSISTCRKWAPGSPAARQVDQNPAAPPNTRPCSQATPFFTAGVFSEILKECNDLQGVPRPLGRRVASPV